MGAVLQNESKSAAQLLVEAEKSAKEIEALYQEKLPTIQNPAHAAEVGQHIKQLAARNDPENLGECKTLTRELRDIAGTQHLMVGDYRVMVKRLRQEAGIHGAEDASTAKMAEQIRKTRVDKSSGRNTAWRQIEPVQPSGRVNAGAPGNGFLTT